MKTFKISAFVLLQLVCTHNALTITLSRLPLLIGDANNAYCQPGNIPAFGTHDHFAQLPRNCINTAMTSMPAPGRTISVTNWAGLRDALAKANCGDRILIAAGSTIRGNNILPAKRCDDAHWIQIRSNAPDSLLPMAGRRLTPCYAGVRSLPGRPILNCASLKVVTAKLIAADNGLGPIQFANGANHYHIGPGLEITRPAGTGVNFNLVDARGISHHIVIDRDWIHGTATDDTRRGVFLGGITRAAVIDSYLNDFHCAVRAGTCGDSQAVAGGTDSKPAGIYRIHNNFMEAAAETVLFGGVSANSATPADIEITRNHMFKPLTWMPGQPGYVGAADKTPSACPTWDRNGGGKCPFIVKNLFELKNAKRVLLEGNILENVWGGFSQMGQSILVNGLNNSYKAVNSQVSVTDLTIRYNRIAHTHSGIGIANPNMTDPYGHPVPSLPIARFSIHDNVFNDISEKYTNRDDRLPGTMLLIGHCSLCKRLNVSEGTFIDHNTVVMVQPRFLMFVGAPSTAKIPNFILTNNLVTLAPGIMVNSIGPAAGPCAAFGSTNLARIQNCFSPYMMRGNGFTSASGVWPLGNFFLPNPWIVQFANYSGGVNGDYRLTASSPFKARATDGKDIGADIDAVNRHIQGVK